MRAVLSIGSNLEDSAAHLARVEEDFAAELVVASGMFATPAWGNTNQPDFLNAILIVEVTDTPLQLLRRAQRLEQEAGRRRLVHWGPRTLDVDIVALCDDAGAEITVDTPELSVPHPFAHERAFVLVPWLAADEAATLGGRRVADLVAALPEDEVAAIRRVAGLP
ncbi:2-amino-4-hydroxy-6-hydroxymethyldihydropteridine diphosphokinase [Corynebacterium uterequi]|uniref:2-amino-4-hydroxy-6-hydroxymethyldihydropteridine diphosphokinase n=1 Tax=Corynebacterium uterequi TaxID=1072256 RepID=A0A0G3HEZ3_9CORY|nr:2-amino-4-hydroxy-6-hydroxymethyldihydropteridine diphosphokinase [Corynebacterium uterequi]AKK11874.1 2-amino-4-hydroxy-6-hydroxymethyldihydropteridine diphosphokinase [Corynebacterium uterequi]